MIDAFVSSLPYWHHIAPIWQELAAHNQAGMLYSLGRTATLIGATPGTPTGDRPVLVAAARDLARIPNHTPVIYTTHGVGQCYDGVPNSLINTTRQQLAQIRLALSPNDQWTVNMRRLGVNTVTVGAPKMDTHPAPPARRDGPPKVGMVFHWDQTTYPEAGSAFTEFAPMFGELTAKFDVVATHHPRAGYQRSHRRSRRKTRVDWYDEAGVRFTEDVGDVLASSDVLIADNTSVLFEAAACGWPVVVLDSRRFRRSVDHGLRFWEWADIGPRTSNPDDLVAMVENGWGDQTGWYWAQDEMRAAVFPHWGEATSRAVTTITEWADQ